MGQKQSHSAVNAARDDIAMALIWVVLLSFPTLVTFYWWQWVTAMTHQMVFLAMAISVGYLIFCVSLLIGITLAARLIPPLKPGTYSMGSTMALRWMLLFAMQRLIYLPLWRQTIFGFSLLRTMAGFALRGYFPLALRASSDVEILEAQLVRIGKGVMLAGGVTLSGHYVEDEVLSLGVIEIGAGSQVLANCQIGKNTRIGRNSTVSMRTILVADVNIGEDCYIGARCNIGPQVEIGPGAIIGHDVVIEPHSVVPPGAKIPSGARIKRDSFQGQHL